MDVFQKKREIVFLRSTISVSRYELTELNWILDFLPADYHNQYLVTFEGNCSQNPRRDVHPVVFNIWPFVLIVNQHTKPGTVCAERPVILIWLRH